MVFGKTEGLSLCNTKQGCGALKAAIRCSADVKLNSLLNEGEDLIAREAKYHKICRRNFFESVKMTGNTGSNQVINVKNQQEAFNDTLKMVKKKVLSDKMPLFGSEIHTFYKNSYVRAGGELDDLSTHKFQCPQIKLLSSLDSKVSYALYDQRRGKFFYRSDLMAHEARAVIDSVTSEDQAAINLGIGIKNQISVIPTDPSSSLTTLANMISEAPVLPYRLKLFSMLCFTEKPV